MPSPMPLVDALKVIRDLRSDEIVVSTMGTAREWPRLSQHGLDLHFVPSAMGQAPALGLGLALAQPARHVIVFNGDGCMLMNLGCLVTLATAGARNLSLCVFDNGIYEVTGGQQTAAARGQVDFAAMARAAGFPSVATYDNLSRWQSEAAAVFQQPGPRFVLLRVAPIGAEFHLDPPGPMVPRLASFRAAL